MSQIGVACSVPLVDAKLFEACGRPAADVDYERDGEDILEGPCAVLEIIYLLKTIVVDTNYYYLNLGLRRCGSKIAPLLALALRAYRKRSWRRGPR
jgi:hypothetical protein